MTLTVYTAPGSEEAVINYALGECQGWLHLHLDRRYPQPELYMSDNEKAQRKIKKFNLVAYKLEPWPEGTEPQTPAEEPKPEKETPGPKAEATPEKPKSGKKE